MVMVALSRRGYCRTFSGADGLQPGDHQDQVDHHRQHRPADEDVGEPHVSGSPAAAPAQGFSFSWLFTITGTPLRSLNAPWVTTS